MKYLLLGLASVLLSASVASASQKVFLTVHSDPEGARVATDTFVGVTPFRLWYKLPSKACTATNPITVTWASGATTTVPVTLCPSVGKEQSVTLARPAAPVDDWFTRHAPPAADQSPEQRYLAEALAYDKEKAGIALDQQRARDQAQAEYQASMLRLMQQSVRDAEYAQFLQSLQPLQSWTTLPRTSALCVTRDVIRGVVFVKCW